MPPRFFIGRIDPAMPTVRLSRDEAHHLARVLRLDVGDRVVAFDAAGAQFDARVESISNQAATLRLEHPISPRSKPPLELTVAISLIKPDPMSWLVQKLTELGVGRLAPFAARRTAMPKADDAKADAARRARWERVSLAACKQCGRPQPMRISPIQPLDKLLEDSTPAVGLRLMAWEGGDARPLSSILAAPNLPDGSSATVLIGPEGGFAEAEYEMALAAGYTPVDLGAYILRAETAAIASAAIILSAAGIAPDAIL